jgi:hypothetical protein
MISYDIGVKSMFQQVMIYATVLPLQFLEVFYRLAVLFPVAVVGGQNKEIFAHSILVNRRDLISPKNQISA